MTRVVRRVAALVATALTGLSPLAMNTAAANDSAANAIQEVIQTRRSDFKKMGSAMKFIAEQLKSDAPDLPKITAAAQAIGAGSRELPKWFPVGSGPESGLDTDALAHIWQDTPKFNSLTNQLGVELQSFSTALSSNDVAAVRSRFKALAEVCSNCHKSFRAD